MLTSDDLAAKLADMNLDAVAAVAGVSKKTLQRFIAKTNKPLLDTANRVFAAIAIVNKPAKRSRAKKTGD